ncbi:HSP20-like chaperone, partial [Aspergillus homomorphus CBS 101889]
MTIRALNQNYPAWGFAARAEEHTPFSFPHNAGNHPHSNPWSTPSGGNQVGRPGHPYPSPWAQFGDEDETNEATKDTGEAAAPRKPYPYPGPAEGHPPYAFPGAPEGRKPYPFPGYAHQPHTYSGPAEGRKPYPSPWDDDEKPKPVPRKPYPYPGPAEGHKPYPYPGALPWRQPYPSPWGDDDDNLDKCKPAFPRQPYQFPGGGPHRAGPFAQQQPYKFPGHAHGASSFPYQQHPQQQPYPFPGSQHGGPSKRGWNCHSPFGGFEGPYNPWAFNPNQTPYAFLASKSEKYQPDVDVFDTPEAFVIHVPLPGAKKEDIEVNWDPKAVELGITGTIGRPCSEELLKTIALDERRVGAFERKVRLGSPGSAPKVDGEAISAKLEDGVLVVEVPKTEPDNVEVKKVEV